MNNLRAKDPGDLQDIGLYLQSLLQVMAVDGHLHEKQQQRIRAYGERVGFEQRYVEKTMVDVLNNKYMPSTPPKFNSSITAREFLRNAIELAICDGQLHPREKVIPPP